MSNQDLKQYLGWGLVGTPAGCQYSSAGIDKQINFGKTVFELGQDLGGCLPPPKMKDSHPLYAFIYREESGSPIVGIASYYSIFEQGQSRAGTYFGSFVESVRAIFTISSLPAVWATLSELNSYQATHFIDFNTMAYKTNNIANQPFNMPKALDHIQLQPISNLLSHAKTADFLFIHCQKGEAEKVAEKVIESGLYRQFKDIYFTESDYISEQMQHKNRLQITASQLLNLEVFIEPWKVEVSALRNAIQQLQKDVYDKSNEIQRLNLEQEHTIQRKVAESVDIQVAAYKKDLDNAVEKMKRLEKEANLGKAQLDNFSQEVANSCKLQLVSELDKQFKSFYLNQRQVSPPPVEKKEIFAIIFGLLVLVVVLAFLIFEGFSSEEKTPKNESIELTTAQKNEINKLNESVQDLCSKLEPTIKQREEVCNK